MKKLVGVALFVFALAQIAGARPLLCCMSCTKEENNAYLQNARETYTPSKREIVASSARKWLCSNYGYCW